MNSAEILPPQASSTLTKRTCIHTHLSILVLITGLSVCTKQPPRPPPTSTVVSMLLNFCFPEMKRNPSPLLSREYIK